MANHCSGPPTNGDALNTFYNLYRTAAAVANVNSYSAHHHHSYNNYGSYHHPAHVATPSIPMGTNMGATALSPVGFYDREWMSAAYPQDSS